MCPTLLVWHVHRQPINGCCDQISPPTKFWQCQKIWRTVLQCDYPYDECQTVSVYQDKLWAELMLENYSISHKLRRSVLRSRNSSDMLPFLNTGCAAVFMWVCRAAYTILFKYTGIAAVHILFMIANISVPRVMQFAVTGRFRTSFLARNRF